MTLNLKIFNNKKGQFYILIALLLISYAFQLARQDVPIRKQKDTFQVLYEGYVNEGANVINNAVYEEANVTARFKLFTDDYVAFAKSAEPGFGLAYLLKHKDTLTVGNRLAAGAGLNVTAGGASFLVSPNSERSVSAATATLTVSGISYVFGFSDDDIQLKALFRASDRLTTRVFVQG